MKQSIQISILGQQFHLKSDESADQVRQIAAFVNDQIAQVTGSGRVVDSLQAAVLTLLNVSAAYLRGEALATSDSVSVERLARLAERIERELDESNS